MKRPWVHAVITAVGIAAAIAGVYFAFLTGGAILDWVLYLREISTEPAGPGAIAVVIMGLFSFVFIVVFGSVTGAFMLIAAWGLEPRRRWREWRAISSKR